MTSKRIFQTTMGLLMVILTASCGNASVSSFPTATLVVPTVATVPTSVSLIQTQVSANPTLLPPTATFGATVEVATTTIPTSESSATTTQPGEESVATSTPSIGGTSVAGSWQVTLYDAQLADTVQREGYPDIPLTEGYRFVILTLGYKRVNGSPNDTSGSSTSVVDKDGDEYFCDLVDIPQLEQSEFTIPVGYEIRYQLFCKVPVTVAETLDSLRAQIVLSHSSFFFVLRQRNSEPVQVDLEQDPRLHIPTGKTIVWDSNDTRDKIEFSVEGSKWKSKENSFALQILKRNFGMEALAIDLKITNLGKRESRIPLTIKPLDVVNRRVTVGTFHTLIAPAPGQTYTAESLQVGAMAPHDGPVFFLLFSEKGTLNGQNYIVVETTPIRS